VCSYHSQCWSLCPFFNWTGDWEAKLWVFILEESSNYNGFILFPLLLCSDPMDSFWNLLGALLKSQATSKGCLWHWCPTNSCLRYIGSHCCHFLITAFNQSGILHCVSVLCFMLSKSAWDTFKITHRKS
jgi:hypothetical protein